MATADISSTNSTQQQLDEAIQSGINFVQALSPAPLSLTSHRVTLEESGVSLHYVRCGPALDSGRCRGALLFIHGWPDCWFSYRHQLAFFAQRGFLCLAPDIRGFGATKLLGRPAAQSTAEDYSWQLACKDLQLLCVAEGVRRVVVIGHDWGGAVAWSFCRRYPTLCAGIVALCTPYRPAKTSYVSPEAITALMPAFAYQVHFARYRKETAAEFNQDIDRTLRCLFRGGDKSERIGRLNCSTNPPSVLQGFPANPPPSVILSDTERAIYASIYRHSGGYATTLLWYATSRLNWEQEGWNWRDEVFDVRRADWQRLRSGATPPESSIRHLSVTIRTPALMVTAGRDPVLRPSLTVGMEEWCTRLRRLHVETAAHWVQMEAPNQVNEAILAFVEQLPAWTNEPVDAEPSAPPQPAQRRAKL